MPSKLFENNPFYGMSAKDANLVGSAASVGSAILSGDQNVYGDRNFQNLGRVGSTGVGTIASRIGDVGISSGNPYGLLGGLAAKGLGGAIDAGSYLLGAKVPEITTQYTGDDFRYDLGDEVSAARGMNIGKTGLRVAGKTALTGAGAGAVIGGPLGAAIGGVGGFIGGLFAGKAKARKLKSEAIQEAEEAQDRFNTANLARSGRQAAMEDYQKRKIQERMLFGKNLGI